ncbi:Oidioi.mRNA.OKI2018_I69.chr2.g7386.t1.cds [Oikopleura dioica]|uniref:Oidioi.mRNA.OKI2018_I69.chr2.g7386.t1.cds n=1 Tax=Oikopleura dioica TaxID=34765 RepID=A0ABN7T9Q2_OIKDI|nr:Oidioi.mRNA.OKI2018_I69.chr2.g7386.t1.cds [Oikopleura dioica]
MLEKFKEDVKDLKTDWIETLDLDPEDFFSEEEKVAYFSKKKELDNEILRRKNLAASYGKIYNEVANLFENKFEEIKSSSLRIQNLLHQTLRSLSSINDNLSVADRPGVSDLLLHHRNVAIDNTDQMYQALDQIISAMSNQCLLNGSSGYKIGITAGGFSPFSTNTREAKTEDIVDATGEIIHPDLQLDEATGLILLKSEAKILENGEFIPCYEDMFFHPQTLEAHKIAGNILYDAATGRISIAVDSAIAASDESESLIPLLPYPRDHLGNPLEIEYLDAPNPMKLKYGTRLVEKSSGLAVPVLAITVHPKTGLVHALGASALSNVTSLKTPIERYLVFDDEDGTSKMVNGLKFDADGKIVPSFFSSISVTLEGGLNKTPEFVHELALSNGSYWGQLEATKAACLARVLDSLDDLTENLSTTLNDPASASASALEHFSKQLTVAVKHLNLSTDKLVQETFKRVLNVTQLKEKITSVEGNGGVCGLYEFDSGNMFLPILIGEKVQDTKDESVAMPILDVEIADDGNLLPVFGTTTDPFSGENIAIELGDETVDATTAEQGRIVGASRDKKTNTICPTVQVGSALNPAKPPFGSVSELQNHITTVNSAIEKLVKASETVSSTIFQETESKMTINEGLAEIKSVLEEMISAAEDVQGSMEIDIVSTLGKLMSNDVLYYLDQNPTDVSNHAKDLSALAGEMKQTMNKFKTRSQANLVRNSLSTSLGKFRFEMMKLNQSQVLIRQQQILAESRLVTDFGTRAESNMYYHGLFVNVHVSTRDEMLPVLKKLAEYLEKGLSMYLTPEMVEYLESACAKLKSREVDEVITNIKEKVEEIHFTTDAQPAAMTSNDENERDEKAILIHEGNQQKMRIENAERYREAIEKLESEREAFIDENILEVQTISKNDEEFNAQADHFSATLAKIDDDLQWNNRLLAEETARNTKRSSDQARPDGAEIYLEDDLKADLSEIEALERKMLDEIDGFEDYVEEANEDLADKLKGLNFEFSSKQGDEVDNIINECSEKIRKRKGRRAPRALLETEHDLTVMYEQLKKAAENDPEAQRLLSELDVVFDAHILARNEAKRKHKDRLEALARQRAARMAAARKPEALTNDINGEVEEVNKSSTVSAEEAKIQELENEFNEKINEINKSCHKDSDELDEQLRNRNLADDMIKDLKIRMAKVEKNRQRQIKAAIALRTAKLQAAKRRKATAEASEVMQSMANISDLGDVTEEDIRNQILEEVTNGKDANQAVKDVLQARHRQEILDMSRRHQCEIEAAKKVALNEARDARYLDRNAIVEQFDRDVLELSTRDIDDAEYDAEFKRLKAQLTAELKAFDEETERLGDRIFNEKRKGLDVKQSAEHLGLLERQLSQIDEEIRKCTSDAQIQYELQQNRLKAQQKHQAEMDEAARQKALEEEERLRQQQEDLLNKKNRLKSDKQSEKERQKAAEEAEKARLEAMVLANEERARVKLENERIQIESSNKNDSEKEKLLRELDAKHAKQAADRAAQTDKARSELEKRLAARRARAAEYAEEESLAEEEISETPAQILIKSEQPQQKKSTVDHSQVLLKSGLIEDLSALEAILKASISLQTGDNSQSAHSDLFLAKQDQLRKTSPGLVIIHPSDLSTLEFVGYRLFQRQFELLSRVFHLEPITIMIANEFPAQEERKSFAPSFYSYQNGIALLDQQHLKSSGLMSVMAAHLASHLAADSHFIDSDVVFKRTFFRAVSLLCAQIPAESLHSSTGEEILDYTSKGQKLREAKYKEHLRNAPQASSHIKHQRSVTENKAKTTQKLGQALELKHDIVLSGENKNSSAEDYFDRLCAQMFDALQEEDEDRIQALQKKLEAAAL